MKTAFKNSWALLDKKERRKFLLLSILSIVISVADILALVALLWIVNFYMQPGPVEGIDWLPAGLADKDSVLLIAVFVFLFALKNIIAFLIARAQYNFSGQVAIKISRDNLARYQQSSYAEYVNTDSSALIRRIALQPFDFSQQVIAGLQQIITQSFLIGMAILAILLFNVKLFLLLLAILLIPVVLVFYLMRKRMAATKKGMREGNEKSYKFLLDAIKGWIEGHTYQRNEFFLDRFMQQRKRFSDNLFQSLSLQNFPSRIIEIFAILGLFILIVVANQVSQRDPNAVITVGAFIAAAYKIIPGLVKIINLAGLIRAYEFLPEELFPFGNKQTQAVKSPLPLQIASLEFNAVSFNYPEQSILNNFSFSVNKGEITGLAGKSGIGKTTVLNLLLGFLKPHSGRILINGKELIRQDEDPYSHAIAYVRQQPFFIYDTIARNITLEQLTSQPGRLDYAIKASGLDKLLPLFPESLEKIITENGKNISGGQQQRIALARAFYKNADLLLLDEPFNELDETSVREIGEELRNLSKAGKLIILVAHDRKSLGLCTKIISLDEP